MPTHQIRVNVNGEERQAEVEERLLLIHLLRGRFRLTATPIGCDTTHCGSCTVLLDDEPVRACALLAVQADRRQVVTVEGLAGADGAPHPLMEALREELDVPCDYCPPGIAVAAAALLARNPEPDEDEICEAIAGNLCRCLAYDQIIRAIQRAAARVAAGRGTVAVHDVEIGVSAPAAD